MCVIYHLHLCNYYNIIYFTALFQAEEMIKTEMLKMLRHDLIKHPSGQISKAALTKIKADFIPYEYLVEEETQQVMTIFECTRSHYIEEGM